uniref:Uncharacterized protein n=1 Tax=Rhizophora mucronata TaxID=61149 RepID=A0A2P2MX22_RHIMU
MEKWRDLGDSCINKSFNASFCVIKSLQLTCSIITRIHRVDHVSLMPGIIKVASSGGKSLTCAICR